MRCSSWTAQVISMGLGRRGSTDTHVSWESHSEADEVHAKDGGQ